MKLKIRIGFSIFKASVGSCFFTVMPNTKGIINSSTTVFRMDKKLSSNVCKYALVSGKNVAQKSKLNGVRKGVNTVAMAVSETESAILALETEEIKLETFPPGQAATRIIPKARAGWGLKSMTRSAVNAGNTMNCERVPIKTLLGFLLTCLKSRISIPKAMPNMIKPKQIFSNTRLLSEN